MASWSIQFKVTWLKSKKTTTHFFLFLFFWEITVRRTNERTDKVIEQSKWKSGLIHNIVTTENWNTYTYGMILVSSLMSAYRSWERYLSISLSSLQSWSAKCWMHQASAGAARGSPEDCPLAKYARYNMYRVFQNYFLINSLWFYFMCIRFPESCFCLDYVLRWEFIKENKKVRKQEKKKKRKTQLDQESDQEENKTRTRPRKWSRKKKVFSFFLCRFLVFLIAFLVEFFFFFSCFLTFLLSFINYHLSR